MKKSRMFAAASAAVVSAAALAISASAYNAYIALQTQNYSFRNAWDDGSYGKSTPYFNSWIVWGDGDTPEETFPQYEDNFDYDIGDKGGYVLPATYTDATIDADGTYTVKASGIDWGLKSESDFNLVFISTDLPADQGIVIKDVSISVDGSVVKTVDEATYDESAQYIQVQFANIWNADLGGWGLAFPTDSFEITFTVSGINGGAADAAPAEEVTAAPAAGDVDAATDSSKGSPDTGIADVAVIAGLAVAAGAGIALTRKRK